MAKLSKKLPTPREVRILQMLAAGMTQKQIAQSLESPLSSVQRSIKNLCQKVGAKNDVQLGGLCLTTGLIEPYYFNL